MKKLIGALFVGIVGLTLIGTIAFADSNVKKKPAFKKFSLELRAEVLFEREMDYQGNSSHTRYVFSGGTYTSAINTVDTGTGSGTGVDFESNRALLDFTFSPVQSLSLIATIGAAKMNVNDSDLDGDAVEFEGDAGLAWGLGFDIKMFEKNGWSIVTGARYLASKTDSTLEVNGQDWASDVDPGDSRIYESELDAYEWNVNLIAKKKIKRFTPYAGVSYSDSKVKSYTTYNYYYSDGSLAKKGSINFDYEQKNNFGVLAGINAEITKNLSMDIGCKLISETNLFGKLSYRF